MRKNAGGRIVLDFDDVMDIIIDLSYSQGFYGRLLRDITELRDEDENLFQNFVEEIESQNFTSSLDVVMYFEG